MKNSKSLIFGIFFISILAACQPEKVQVVELPNTPTASFEIQPTANPNKFLLVNKTADAFLFKWDLGNGTVADSSEVAAYYPFKGTYTVTLSAFNRGGFGKTSQTITVQNNDAAACSGNFQKLTNCGKKIWKLSPTVGALKVGPDVNFSTVWWQNNAADVTTRPCMFNDEYSFSNTGVFQYDNKGDFWADTDGNGLLIPSDIAPVAGCQAASILPSKYSSWGSSSNTFSATSTELAVNGTGAFIALYKVGNGAEVNTPQSSVVYKIKEITNDKLVLTISYGSGFWQFTLVPK